MSINLNENVNENDLSSNVMIGGRVKKVRENSGLTVIQFAKKIGINGNSDSSIRQTLHKYESGKSPWPLRLILSISEEFDVSTDYLLKGVNEINNTNDKMDSFTSGEVNKDLIIADLVRQNGNLTAMLKSAGMRGVG